MDSLVKNTLAIPIDLLHLPKFTQASILKMSFPSGGFFFYTNALNLNLFQPLVIHSYIQIFPVVVWGCSVKGFCVTWWGKTEDTSRTPITNPPPLGLRK